MNTPNSLTLFRILLTPVFFTLLVSYEPGKDYYRWWAFVVFSIAALTDAIDGFIARKMKQKTALGQFLDPLADKLLLMSGYLGLLVTQSFPIHPPLWITVTIVFRDIVIIAGMFMIFFSTGNLRAVPNRLGKITTFSQMVTLIFILLGRSESIYLCYITAFFTITSCLVYIKRDMKLLGHIS